MSQVEFASVVILNKCDLVTDTELHRVKSVIKCLNNDASMNYINLHIYIVLYTYKYKVIYTDIIYIYNK